MTWITIQIIIILQTIEFLIVGIALKLKGKSVLTKDTIRCSIILDRVILAIPSVVNLIVTPAIAKKEQFMIMQELRIRLQQLAVNHLLALHKNI